LELRELIAHRGPHIAILGPPGSGKSTLLESLVRDLNKNGVGGLPCCCIYLDLRSLIAGPEPSMAEQLSAMLQSRAGRFDLPIPPGLPIGECLSHLAKDGSRYIVVAVDHLDDVPFRFAIELAQHLRSLKEMSEGELVPAKVGIIVSGCLSVFRLRRQTQSGLAQTTPFTLPRPALESRKKLVMFAVKKSARNLSFQALECLAEESGGEPAFLMPILDRLTRSHEFDGSPDALSTIIDAVPFEQSPYLRRVLISILYDTELAGITRALVDGGQSLVGAPYPDIDPNQLQGAVIADRFSYRFRNRIVAKFVRNIYLAMAGGRTTIHPLVRDVMELRGLPDQIAGSEDIWSVSPFLLRAWEATTPYSARPRLHVSITLKDGKPRWLELMSPLDPEGEVPRPDATENADSDARVCGTCALAYDDKYVAFGAFKQWQNFKACLIATGVRAETQYTEAALSHWEGFARRAMPGLIRLALTAFGTRLLDGSTAYLPDGGSAVEEIAYDVFLSFASSNREDAEAIKRGADELGVRLFLSAVNLETGSAFSEQIREAITGSEHFWLLATPEALQSTWVHTEWGAAWILDKPITPILLRLSPEQLPDRLRTFHVVDYHKYPGELKKMSERRTLSK
jgi:hypothetical protein